MARLLNMVRQTVSAVASSGTGALTLSTAASGYDTFAGAGAVDGAIYSYAIQEGTKWEVGRGTYTASGTTLARTTIIRSSQGNGVAETFTTAAICICTELKEDFAGRQSIWIPAAAMKARTTLPPASGTNEMTTNKNMLLSLDFDASTIEYAQFMVRMPKSWDLGTVTFAPTWSHPSTTTNFKAAFGLQAVALADAAAGDVAFGTAQYSNDTGGTTNAIYHGPECSAITVAGSPSQECAVMFQVLRNATDGTNDTLAVDARLHGITLYINTRESTD